MKTYTDFILDITSTHSLLQELNAILPFPSIEGLMEWFSSKGYQLADCDADLLYQHQNALLNNDEQVNY